MSVTRIASRYAKSLLDLATEQNAMEEILGDMQGFSKMLKQRDLLLLIKSPIVNVDKKASIFNALFDGKVNPLTKSFFDIVLRKRREALLPEIAEAFIAQYKELKGISEVTLTTAKAMTPEALEAIKTKLLGSDVTATSLDIKTVIDESLIGGFIIQIDDNLIDASVAYKLKELSKTMTNKEYIKAI